MLSHYEVMYTKPIPPESKAVGIIWTQDEALEETAASSTAAYIASTVSTIPTRGGQ